MALDEKEAKWLVGGVLAVVGAVATTVAGAAIWHTERMEDQAARMTAQHVQALQTADEAYQRELKACRDLAISQLTEIRKVYQEARDKDREANNKALFRLLDIFETEKKK